MPVLSFVKLVDASLTPDGVLVVAVEVLGKRVELRSGPRSIVTPPPPPAEASAEPRPMRSSRLSAKDREEMLHLLDKGMLNDLHALIRRIP